MRKYKYVVSREKPYKRKPENAFFAVLFAATIAVLVFWAIGFIGDTL